MVKVNIEYNPYIMDFKAKFNGKEPRINSLIEKYEMHPLQEWLGDVPEILHNEMNGYDFDLEFIGPKLDYEDLVQTLRKAKISEKDVRCIYSKELECRKDKLREIMDLSSWLNENRNHRFDIDTFKVENQDKLDNNQSIIVIGDTNLGDFEFENTSISIEMINDFNELEKTAFEETPIILEVERFTTQEVSDILGKLLSDSDIIPEQLFFFVNTKSSIGKYYRVITDLGVSNPQIISGIDDAKLFKYFEYYPVTNYIREWIRLVRTEYSDLYDVLRKDKEEAEEANSEVIENISNIENKIEKLKKAIHNLKNVQETNYVIEDEAIKERIINSIENWRIKKTKATNQEEAEKLATQFKEEIIHSYSTFIKDMNTATDDLVDAIYGECNLVLEEAEEDKIPNPVILGSDVSEDENVLDTIREELLEIKEESYEKPKESLLGVFLKTSTLEEKEEILVTSYPMQKWRELVLKKVNPLVETYICNKNKEANEYSRELTRRYIDKLEEILKSKIDYKNEISKQLSDDILVLQQDGDWLKDFDERLSLIERG